MLFRSTAPVVGTSQDLATDLSLAVSVTDPGASDVVTCSVKWGDGTTEALTWTGTSCDGTHTYATVGTKLISVTATDDALDSAAAGVAVTLTSDTAGPEVTTLALQQGSDTGRSATDGITKASTLTFDVAFDEALAGSLDAADLTLAAGTTATGCTIGTPAGADADWTVDVTGCGDGDLVLAVLAGAVTDGASNAGPAALSPAALVTIDRTAPTLAVSATTVKIGRAHV